MRKGLITIIVFLICVVSSSCGEKFGYKNLDGMWQLQEITNLNTGETFQSVDEYYSFQMNIIQVKKIGYGTYFGSFTYNDDVIHTKFKASASQLKIFGLSASEEDLIVEQLNNNRLVLRSDNARIRLRKY